MLLLFLVPTNNFIVKHTERKTYCFGCIDSLKIKPLLYILKCELNIVFSRESDSRDSVVMNQA